MSIYDQIKSKQGKLTNFQKFLVELPGHRGLMDKTNADIATAVT